MKKLKDCEFQHVTPEEVGVKSSAITAFINEINEKGLGVQSFTFVRHDKVFAQCFWKPYAKDIPHVLYSMSKSVTSTAVGFCVAEGLLNLDDKVYKFFPEHHVRGIQNKSLTVRMLLTMRSDKLITVFEEKGKKDWIKSFFAAPFLAPPDTTFNYISENTFMLSAIVSKVTGMSMVDYLYPRMFEPLGIEKPFWETDGKGNNSAGWGLYMKSEDLAKFFLPYLHGGKYKDGTQLVPAQWVEMATAKQTDSVKDGYIDNMNGYGFQFWRNPLPNSYRADGLFGQRCFFLPEYDAMMVLNCGQSEDYKVMKVFWKHFPEAFENEALEPDEEAYREMCETMEKCSAPDLPATERNRRLEEMIGGRTMTCKTSEYVSVVSISVTQMLYNKPGKINAMRFDFNESGARFYWKEKNYENTINVGMDGSFGVSEIVLGDLHYTTYAKAAWQNDGSLKLWIRPVQTAHVRQFTFFFEPDGKTVKVINEMEPKFDELVIYNFVFLGMPLPNELSERAVKDIVRRFGLPVIEPDFKATFIN